MLAVILRRGQSTRKDDILFKQTYASLLNQLAEMPIFLERTMASLPADMLQRPPIADQFPLIEHLWHVRDCDPDLYAFRIRKVLQEERPALAPVDVGAWYVDRRYRARSGQQAISEFAKLRADLIKELKDVEECDLARVGMRADGCEISVHGLIEQLAEHDRDHRWRITSILGGFATAR
jgi:hypothetical protein